MSVSVSSFLRSSNDLFVKGMETTGHLVFCLGNLYVSVLRSSGGEGRGVGFKEAMGIKSCPSHTADFTDWHSSGLHCGVNA